MSRFGKFLTGGTGKKIYDEDNSDAFGTGPKDYGQTIPLKVNYLGASDSGQASYFLINLGKTTCSKWIPNSLISDLPDIDWNGGDCEINVPKWWWDKEKPSGGS